MDCLFLAEQREGSSGLGSRTLLSLGGGGSSRSGSLSTLLIRGLVSSPGGSEERLDGRGSNDTHAHLHVLLNDAFTSK